MDTRLEISGILYVGLAWGVHLSDCHISLCSLSLPLSLPLSPLLSLSPCPSLSFSLSPSLSPSVSLSLPLSSPFIFQSSVADLPLTVCLLSPLFTQLFCCICCTSRCLNLFVRNTAILLSVYLSVFSLLKG